MPESESPTPDDAVWGALNDATRREILDLLRIAPRTTGDLCDGFDVTRFAVMKHLRVLEAAGLVVSEKRGRTRTNYLNPVPLQQIYRRWIAPFDALPADRLLTIKRLTETKKEARQ